MTTFSLGSLVNSSAWNLFRMRERIDMNPEYQREGDVWTEDKRRLLIDTIINGFDVPKIYMHRFAEPLVRDGKSYEYAVIDGKQRLSAIWGFIQGSFALDQDFTYIRDPTVAAKGLTYAELGRLYPDVKADFDAYNLTVITIETRDLELIEDMFSRLNEAVPLNAAEKRNARPGPLPDAVRLVASGPFFVDRLPFTNRRYRHYDLAAKMLLLASREAVVDTKKAYIDKFFEEHAESTTAGVDVFFSKTNLVLAAMASVFVDKDVLLRSVGMVQLYFLLFERGLERGLTDSIIRQSLVEFESSRRDNRLRAEADVASADYSLLEFDRYTQSPNDAVAMRYRLGVVDEKVFGGTFGFAPAG